MKKTFPILVVGALFLLMVFGLFFCSEPMTEKVIDDQYEKITVEANCIKITDKAQVRSEPIVLGRAGGQTNSFGMISEAGFTVEVGLVYRTNKVLDTNGAFYGILVEDVLSTPEGKRWFPGCISKDVDGIVWINCKYVEIV